MEVSISRALCALVFLCQLFCYGGADFCEDKSISIQNGNIECASYYQRYSSIKYKCTVKCAPGYVEKPAKEISCSSNGNRVWKVDGNGQSAQVYYGTWTADFSEVKCEAPKTCPDISEVDKPRYGRAVCSSNNTEKICIRNCEYPYEVTEPEFRKERCGPDTKFFWSHVLRHNSTKMSPCAPPRTCRPLRESDMPHHGKMICKRKEWADTVICELHCERGYISKSTSKAFEFCGPTTAYIWSHLHTDRNPSARIGGCEQAPITTEVVMRFNRSCDTIDTNEINLGVNKIFGILNSTIGNITLLNIKLNVSLISWRTACQTETIHEEIEVKNSVYGLWADYIDKEAVENLVIKDEADPSSNNNHAIDQPLNQPLSVNSHSKEQDGYEIQISGTHNSPQIETIMTPNTQETAKNASVLNETNETQNESENKSTVRMTTTMPEKPDYTIPINKVVADMIFSFHLKVNCKYGKCREACAVLGISKIYNRCLELCKSKAGPANKQVRHLSTSYTHRIIEAIDVSTASYYLPGSSFKLLNVTSKDSDNYSPSEQDVNQITQNECTLYSSHCHDQC